MANDVCCWSSWFTSTFSSLMLVCKNLCACFSSRKPFVQCSIKTAVPVFSCSVRTTSHCLSRSLRGTRREVGRHGGVGGGEFMYFSSKSHVQVLLTSRSEGLAVAFLAAVGVNNTARLLFSAVH